MNDILSQIIAYAPNKIDTETKARSLVQGPRNMYAGGGRMRFDKGGFTDADILEIKSKLPEGINIEYDTMGSGEGRWRYTTSISKADGTKTRMRLPMLKAFDLEADENLKKILEAKGKGKEVFDLSLKIGGKTILTPEKFYELRLKDPKSSLDKFLEKLTKKGFVKPNGKPFGSRSALHRLQQELGIADLVGGDSNAARKRSIQDVKAIVRTAPNGPQILKSITDESELRKIANALVSRDRLYERRGSFPVGRSKENKMWHNLWRASNTGDRIEIIGEFADGKLPVDSNGRVNWQMPDKNGVPAWKRVQFIDNQKNKAPLKWIDMPGSRSLGNQGQLRSQVDNIYGKGFFDRKMKPYDLQKQIGDLEIDIDGQKVKVGTILNENIVKSRLMDKLIKENNGAVPTEAEFNKKYDSYRNKLKLFNSMNVQHTKGVGLDPYTTELTTQSANAKERTIVQKYNTAIKKTTDPTELLKLSNNFANDINKLGGGIRSFDVQTGTVKGTKATPSSIATQLVDEARLPKETGDKIKNLLTQDLLKLAGTKNKKCKGLLSYGGRAGLAEGLSPEFCINEGKKVARNLIAKNITGSPAQNNIIKRITSGVTNFAKSILDPKELFDLKKQFLSKGALASIPIFDAVMAADDALRKDMDPKEAFAKTLTFGTLPRALGFTDSIDVINAKKMLEDPSLSPAGKEYAQLIIDSGDYKKMQSDTTGGMTKKFTEFKEMQDKIKNASTSGRFDYENALAEMQGTFKAKPKENKFFFDDAPDTPDVTPLTNKLATPAKSRGSMTEMKKQKVDLTPTTYQNYKPYSFTKEEFEDTMRKIGALKEGQVYNEDFYKEQIEKPMRASQFKEYMELPSFRGTQEKFMEGGIASLNVKK